MAMMEPSSSSSSSTASAVTPSSAPPSGRCCVVLRIKLPAAWTPEEDAALERLAVENGSRHWRRVAAQMPRKRSPVQCRDRWRDHLARDVFHRPYTAADDDELTRLVLRPGGGGDRWKDISRAVHGRSSRSVKRRWMEIGTSDELLRKLWHPRSSMLSPATVVDAVPSSSSNAVADDQCASAVTPSSAPPSGRCCVVLRIRLRPAWTPEEDAALERLAVENGSRHWRRVAAQMPRKRSPAQCRDRWRTTSPATCSTAPSPRPTTTSSPASSCAPAAAATDGRTSAGRCTAAARAP
uniref:Uncharacterized protein n=1 Tax=Oryza rufipogon TaxID=4529 RepID=A0A0E0PW12_ORYRU